MPNEYSVEIHRYISARLEAARTRLDAAEDSSNSDAQAYWKGQIAELQWLRDYLAEHVDLKNFTYY
jgi:hypothetical protein